MTQITITSCNVRGINGGNKRRDVLEYLRNMKSNIYCIQDIHCSLLQIPQFKQDWAGDMIISCGTSNSRGVAILINRNFEYKIMEIKRDTRGNYIGLKSICSTLMSA
jgi:exonuclease III